MMTLPTLYSESRLPLRLSRARAYLRARPWVVGLLAALCVALAGLALGGCAGGPKPETARIMDSYRIFWESACADPPPDLAEPCARAEREMIAAEPALEGWLAERRGWAAVWTVAQPVLVAGARYAWSLVPGLNVVPVPF